MQASASDIFPTRAVEPDLVEGARRLFARECRFVAGAANAAAMPPERTPEVAFAGRSNVGKSSLVNALTGRRMLARISNTPGRTRQINFFDLGGRLTLVDLPGYGYAEAPARAIRAWTALLARYLRQRTTLHRTYLLVDSRHGLKEPDREIMRALDAAGVSYQAVLTKVDKITEGDAARVAAAVAEELSGHPAAHPEIHLTSAREGRGIAALRAALASFVLPLEPARESPPR